MKIVKEHMGLPTDTSAFRGVEAFLSGLELPLKDAVTISEEEHRELSKSMRELESHVISNLLPFLDQNLTCKAKITDGFNLCANIFKRHVSLFIENIPRNSSDAIVTVSLAKNIIAKESLILYDLQRDAKKIIKEQLMIATQEQEEEPQQW